MDEAQEILLRSLQSAGVALPSGVSSVRDLSPDALFSICVRSLCLIDPSSPPLRASLPDPAADRFRACADVVAVVRSLGYRGELTLRQLLYPLGDDSYKLLRFLVERLSEPPEGSKKRDTKLIGDIFEGDAVATQNVKDILNPEMNVAEDAGQCLNAEAAMLRNTSLGMKKDLSESSETASVEVHVHTHTNLDQANESGNHGQLSSNQECHSCEKEAKEPSHGSEMDQRGTPLDKDTMTKRYDRYSTRHVEKPASLHNQMKNIVEEQQSREKLLMEHVHAKSLELQDLEYEVEILKTVAEMAFSNHHHAELFIEELNKRVEARRCKLLELEFEWNTFEKSFEERRILLEHSLYADRPEQWKRLQQLKEIKIETDAIFSEIHKRNEEYSKLAAVLEKQPKSPTRKSYIQRITEITKNSRKQDADIQRIIKDTRELQIESNSISERLHRIYAVVDETIFREAKNDPIKRDPFRKNVYRLLTSIHDNFEQIADKILATDRTRRESADLEAKLAGLPSRSVDIYKLQADLDAIKKENELLEQQLQHV